MAHDIDKGKEVKIEDAVDFLKSHPVNKINVPGGSKNNLPDIPFEKWLRSFAGDTPLGWEYQGCVGHDTGEDECVVIEVVVKIPEGRCPGDDLIFRLMPRIIPDRPVRGEPILIFGEDAYVYFINDDHLGLAKKVEKSLGRSCSSKGK